MGGSCDACWGRPRAIGAQLLILVALALSAQLLLANCTHAAEKNKASTSRASRAMAIKSLPLEQLTPEWQDTVTSVIKKATIYRRLPTQVVDCDPELYDYLLDNPDLLVGIWEAMGISNVELERTGKNTFQASDGDGTKAKLFTLHRTAESQLIYAQGTYHGPLFRKPVRARCVMLLRYATIRETNGRYYVTAVLDTFIKLDHIGVELLAKTFYPLVGKVADYNFRETMNFVSSLSQTMERHPQSIKRLSKKLDQVSPKVRREFQTIATRLSEDSSPGASVASKRNRTRLETRLVQRNQPVPIRRESP